MRILRLEVEEVRSSIFLVVHAPFDFDVATVRDKSRHKSADSRLEYHLAGRDRVCNDLRTVYGVMLE